VLSIPIVLALDVLLTGLPAASAPADATVAVCFAPEQDCDAFAVIRAKERGVDVRVVADREAPCGQASGIDPLAAAGVPVWIDDRARMAHAKTMVVDGAVTLTGSYNWTRGAAANSEDLNLISSPAVAEAYAAHWRQRLAVSVRFDRRENWCRASSAEAR